MEEYRGNVGGASIDALIGEFEEAREKWVLRTDSLIRHIGVKDAEEHDVRHERAKFVGERITYDFVVGNARSSTGKHGNFRADTERVVHLGWPAEGYAVLEAEAIQKPGRFVPDLGNWVTVGTRARGTARPLRADEITTVRDPERTRK